MNIALSTLAMSAYNVLARNGGPAPARSIFNVVVAAHEDPTITPEDFAAALARLETYRYIRIVDAEKGLVDVLDPNRRVVRWRKRTNDGWDGWMVEGAKGQPEILFSIDLGASS